VRTLSRAKPGRASPTGTEFFISTYRRSDFRLSRSLMREMNDPHVIQIVVGRNYAYIGPHYPNLPSLDMNGNEVQHPDAKRVTYDGKFSSKELKDWLNDPDPGTHYAAKVIAPGVARISKRGVPSQQSEPTSETAATDPADPNGETTP
jgi:hypothetical protein